MSSSDDVMRLGKFDNNDITETLLDYCDCGGHGCEPCYAAEVIRRLRAENDDMQVLLRGRTAELQAEVKRLRAAGDALAAIVGDVVVPFDDESKAWTMATAYGTWQEARRER